MNTRTITGREVREILANLDRVKELTDLLRRAHFEVPYKIIYDAVGAEIYLRNKLLEVALVDVEVEAAPVLRHTASAPAGQSEVV
jgi:hypothetical protein